MSLTVNALRERLARGEPTFILDVRAAEDFATWKVEGPRPIETLNVPLTRILGEVDAVGRAAAAAAFLGKSVADEIPRKSLVVAVCTRGLTSVYVAEGLRSLGYDAVSLDGGMTAWGNHYEALTVVAAPASTVIQVARPARGCLSWIAISEGEAVVIDPLRHVERYTAILEEHGARALAVIDTHAHADHISGGRALAAATGAPYYLHPYDAIHPIDMLPATFDFEFLHERRCLSFGGSTLDVLHVPGHTLGAVALLLDERVLFGGDTLFLDAVARPDLGGRTDAWTPLHHASLARLLALSGDVLLCPGHFSAAREADPSGAFAARIASLPERNEGARRALGDASAFASYIASSLPVFPPQYVDIKRVNAGLIEAAEDRASELELGKNVCALAAASTIS